MNGLQQRYRLWIVAFERWEPRRLDDVPPRAIAQELLVEEHLSADEARDFVLGFNDLAAREGLRRWAIAVPVTLRFEGDLRPGQRLGT